MGHLLLQYNLCYCSIRHRLYRPLQKSPSGRSVSYVQKSGMGSNKIFVLCHFLGHRTRICHAYIRYGPFPILLHVVIFTFTVELALLFPSARPNSFSSEYSASSKIGYGCGAPSRLARGRPRPRRRSAYRDSSFASSALKGRFFQSPATRTGGFMR